MHRLRLHLDDLQATLLLDRPGAARTTDALLRALPMPVDLHGPRIAGRLAGWLDERIPWDAINAAVIEAAEAWPAGGGRNPC